MDCPHFPEISYAEFSKRLHRQGENQRLPLNCSLELTERCNLRCAHCYINQPAADPEAKRRELSFRQWIRIIDEIQEAGCLWLLLTGGEPLLRPDFTEIYAYLKKRGFIITLFTNGTLITPELADFLQDWSPFSLEITIYGRTKATYEAMTGVSGSYEKCVRSIDLLLARKIPLVVKAMVTTLNVHELWDMKAWAQGLGVTFRYDAALNARLDGGQEPLALRLTPDQVVDLDLRDPERFGEWQRLATNYLRSSESEFLYVCGAGNTSFHLDPYGQLHLCLLARTAAYDLTRGTFQDAWQEFIPALRCRKPMGDYPCNHCELIVLCGQCPGWSQLEFGNEETPLPYLCRIAYLRAAALGVGLENRACIR